ncbi:MAG: nucleotidyltransferase [Lachnospiraceae bacterium]|nr:nucleotidyltransferase [Lachnospiraceae bacterium]
MKTVGIIAEYNPFHNGHAYLLSKAKEVTGADYCIVVMSGDFVQRGAPALMNKYLRTEIALRNGADIVLELPVCYSLSSAEYYASGAVALLDKLGVTDTLCFGSECGDIKLLSEFASQLLSESKKFKSVLNLHLRSGMSYPNARNMALQASAPHLASQIGVMLSPNNILGIEYCKALSRRASSIVPYTIRRTGACYHDASLDAGYSSALAIRSALAATGELSSIQDQVPLSAYTLMEDHYGADYPIFSDDLSTLLHYQLLSELPEGYTSHPDIDQKLSDRIAKMLPQYQDFHTFCELLNTKNRTYTRIARSMMHILLHIQREEMTTYCEEDYIFYARMLGFRKDAKPLLSAIKENSAGPLISKLADADALLTPTGREMLTKDIFASHIYQLTTQHKFQTAALCEHNEYRKQLVRV